MTTKAEQQPQERLASWDKEQFAPAPGRGPGSHGRRVPPTPMPCHAHLRSFKHLPLVEDFHGVNPFSVLHFDDSDLEYKRSVRKAHCHETMVKSCLETLENEL